MMEFHRRITAAGRVWLPAVVVLIAVTSGSLLATPPDSIKLNFDPAAHVLSAEVFHPVRNAVAHHIGTITVMLNGKLIITQTFDNQTDNLVQDASYVIIDAKAGDALSLTAACNMTGKMTATLLVPSDSAPGGGN